MKINNIIGLLLTPLLVGFLVWGMGWWEAPPSPPETEEEDKMASIEGRYLQEYLMTRDPRTGEVPRHRLLAAYAHRKALLAERAPDDLPIFWQERGPNDVGGRTRALLFDANDPTNRTVWAGSVSGGLWRTTNIDANPPNWVPINDLFQNLAISSIAQDPTNPNLLYFGTGECFGNVDAVLGLGIWMSTDGGGTWTQMPAIGGGLFPATPAPPNSPCIIKLVVDNNGNLFAATRWQGVARFDAANNQWVPVLNSLLGVVDGFGNPTLGTNGNFVTDLEIAPNGDMWAAFNADQVYRSTDGGFSWNPASNGLNLTGVQRIQLAVAPSAPGTLYALLSQPNPNPNGVGQTCLGFFQTTDFGANWTALTCPSTTDNQLWYDLILAVDPTDPTRVFAGLVGLYLSEDSGNSWTTLGGIHVDHHMILFDPGDPTRALFGNDGGVYLSTNADNSSPSFIDKNLGYNVTQYYAMALHPDSASNVMIGGTQDNGSHRLTNPGLGAAISILGADGGWCFIDQDTPDIRIASQQFGSFFVSTNGGGSYANFIPANNNRIFITPAGYDDDSNILYISDTPGRLGRLSGIGGVPTFTSDTIPALNGRFLTAFAPGPLTNNRLFVGTNDGRVFQVDNAGTPGGTTFTNLNFTGPGNWISSIAVDPADEGHLLVTLSNYGINSIWETTDGGTTWQSVEGDLPDMPVRWGLFWPTNTDAALIATELGVWYAKDLDGANTQWRPTNDLGFANCRVDMLVTRASDDLIGAATHGRGIYTSDYFSLLNQCTASLTLPGNIPSGLYMAAEFISSDGTVADRTTVVFQAGEYIELLPDFTAERGSNFWALIKDCTPSASRNRDESIAAKEVLLLEEPPEEDELNARNDEDPTDLPAELRLVVHPNPSRSQGHIHLELPESLSVRLYLLNAQGMLVQDFASGFLSAGAYDFTLDAAALDGGMYLVVLRTPREVRTERVVVVK
ncbi:MAG: T9SS C-terminal target domain-containing protein [Bacteroidetes bacterium]|nr:MAG: T9SS C-terminal target domain-containing protein [Bacteroidota bacterium]